MAEGKGHPEQFKGWLLKWTNYIKGYQRRWFVLSNGLLSYYRYVCVLIVLKWIIDHTSCLVWLLVYKFISLRYCYSYVNHTAMYIYMTLIMNIV